MSDKAGCSNCCAGLQAGRNSKAHGKAPVTVILTKHYVELGLSKVFSPDKVGI